MTQWGEAFTCVTLKFDNASGVQMQTMMCVLVPPQNLPSEMKRIYNYWNLCIIISYTYILAIYFPQLQCKKKKIIFSSKTNTAISIGTTYILKWETKSWNFAVIVFLFLMAHQAIISIQRLKQPAKEYIKCRIDQKFLPQ